MGGDGVGAECGGIICPLLAMSHLMGRGLAGIEGLPIVFVHGSSIVLPVSCALSVCCALFCPFIYCPIARALFCPTTFTSRVSSEFVGGGHQQP